MKTFNYLLLLSFLVLTACKKENTQTKPESIKQDGLWPMNLGNEWHYVQNFYKLNGSVESTSPDEKIVISDTVTFEGHLFFGYSGIYYSNIDANTVQTIISGSGVDNPVSILFKRVFTNDTVIWHYDDPACVYNQTNKGFTGITNVNGHACLRNEKIIQSCDGIIYGKEVHYLEPGVGEIRFEEYTRNADTIALRVSRELTSYKL